MLDTLLYVSRSNLAGEEIDSEVRAIVDAARTRNAALDVTGALISTGRYFVQFLEGPPDGVASIMERVRADSRHGDLIVVLERTAKERRFKDWSMAYIGASNFVQRRIAPFVERTCAASPFSNPRAADNVIRMMAEFAAQQEHGTAA
jgi:hypothetical protein